MYISQDPIGLAGGNPTLYGYVKDSNWWVDVFELEVVTSTEIRIMEFTSHGVNRATERSVAPRDILSAVKKPLKVSDIKIDSEGSLHNDLLEKKQKDYAKSEINDKTILFFARFNKTIYNY